MLRRSYGEDFVSNVVSLSHSHLGDAFNLLLPKRKNSEIARIKLFSSLSQSPRSTFFHFSRYQALRCEDKTGYRALVVGEMTWCIGSLLFRDIVPIVDDSWSEEQKFARF